MSRVTAPLCKLFTIPEDITSEELLKIINELQNMKFSYIHDKIDEICSHHGIYLYMVRINEYNAATSADSSYSIARKLFEEKKLPGVSGSHICNVSGHYYILMSRKMILSHNTWNRVQDFLDKCEEKSTKKKGGVICLYFEVPKIMEYFYEGFADYFINEWLG